MRHTRPTPSMLLCFAFVGTKKLCYYQTQLYFIVQISLLHNSLFETMRYDTRNCCGYNTFIQLTTQSQDRIEDDMRKNCCWTMSSFKRQTDEQIQRRRLERG